jgi:L-lactate dehydrogenase complex protein LldG
MTSREKILSAVTAHQPQQVPLPEISAPLHHEDDHLNRFCKLVQAIGGTTFLLPSNDAIIGYLHEKFSHALQIVVVKDGIIRSLDGLEREDKAHDLAHVQVAVIFAAFGVAENGAVWITEKNMGDRVLPFICEHLIAVVHASDILATMEDAYEKIGNSDYGFGGFIAGPSKTADIEQSLVLGAHGPKTMTVLILLKDFS